MSASLKIAVSALCLLLATDLWAQQPILKVAGKDSAMVRLQKFNVQVKVTGTTAITTMEMEFCNSADRVLEGELTFPMPEGVSVSRYALDINGKMREAVPIEKEKGQVVFENIERRNVDPGLLEKTTGNTFRTRIYPIPANGCRTIIVGYQQQLTLTDPTAARYDLPLHFKAPINDFGIDFKVFSSAVPELGKDCSGLLQFDKKNEVYNASMAKRNYLPDANFSIVIPQWPDAADVLIQQKNYGQYFFTVNIFPVIKSVAKALPANIGIVWDVSLSGLNRKQDKAFELLDAYFKRNPNTAVALTLTGFTSTAAGTYTISGGNWAALKAKLESVTYDGATNFGSLQSWTIADEYLFFTDGLSTYGSRNNMVLPGKPVHTINASPNADFGVLQHIAGQTGGSFVNLEALPIENAVRLLTEQQWQFMGIAPNNAISECYPLKGTPVAGNCTVSGISNTAHSRITLLFGDGKQVLYQKEVALDALADPFIEVDKLWAQQKIAALEQQYEQNKDLITQLGKQYGLVTQNTSLIVLDAVEDYVRYEIEPPAELRTAYNQLMRERFVRQTKLNKKSLTEAVSYYNRLVEWWNKDFAVRKLSYKTTVKSEALMDANVSYMTVTDVGGGAAGAATPPPAESPAATADPQQVRFTPPRIVRDEEVRIVAQNGLVGATTGVSVQSNQTNLNQANQLRVGWAGDANKPEAQGVAVRADTATVFAAPLYDSLVRLEDDASGMVSERAYLKQLDSANSQGLYAKYLSIRADYLADPVFYFDVAKRLLAAKDTATGLLVLSNIADLGYDDHELYKMLGYQLRALRQYDEAVHVFRKVLQWRPQEPQSYRDYGLALADAGWYQQALDNLYLALTKNFDEDISSLYPGVEEIIVTDINNLIARHGKALNTSGIDKRLLRNLPVDVRVVLNWNMNDSDIDLWVIDPRGEKCFYSNTLTQMGGRISADFTRGYSPEQFMLKKALKGQYKVMLHYYGDRQQKIAGPATVMAEIYTHYGKPNQQRKIIALQMEKENGQEVLISSFKF